MMCWSSVIWWGGDGKEWQWGESGMGLTLPLFVPVKGRMGTSSDTKEASLKFKYISSSSFGLSSSDILADNSLHFFI